ncbi:MAG: tetratricopeptide repeat protein [Gemmatimonadaceae bacterium]
MRSIAVSVLLALAVACAPQRAATSGHDNPSLGRVHLPISCPAPAQQELERALILLHHMTYPQARESFRKVVAVDSSCAMGYWGVAMTLFQPMWPTRPGPSDLRLGWEMAQRARAAPRQSQREQLFVATVEAFFQDPESTDYWARIRRWERATEAAYSVLPNDAEATAFYALAHLAVAQAAGGSRSNHDRAAALLGDILAANPSHPGAVHYLIHANDFAAREGEALDVVRGYDRIAPENPHALHMPTHIYVRLGDWQQTITGNLKAAEAALRYPAGDQGQYVWDEFPHAIEYLVYAYLQRGADDDAHSQITRLQRTQQLEPTFKTAFNFGVHRCALCAGAQGMERGCGTAPSRACDIPMGSFSMARSHCPLRAWTWCRA